MTDSDVVEFEIRDGERVALSFSSEDMSWDEFLAWYGVPYGLDDSARRGHAEWLGETIG